MPGAGNPVDPAHARRAGCQDARVNPEEVGAFIAPDYYESLARLRREEPVRQYAPNAWTVARYAEVRDISRDPERFCSGRGVLVNDPLRTGGEIQGSILHMDPPEHAPWRKLTSRRFTPRAVIDTEPAVRRVVRDLLDALPRDASVDFVDAVAAPFPVLVIADLLGVSGPDRAEFRRWSDATIESPDHPGERLADMAELYEFLIAHVKARRTEPRDDLVSLLATAEVDGRPLSTREAVTYVLSLLIAGNETTRHLTSGSVIALAEHPDQRARLAADPTGIPAAVEECLRWVTPIQAFGRTATRATELAGQSIAEGDFVVMLYASANRDEMAFGPTADRFDVARRPDHQHMAFGFGEHLCLGAALARLEARVLLEELLARFPTYEIAGAPTWIASTLVRGVSALPVHLSP
ncbi:MAG TPA: cytochrome P450 [Acidimicrobiia bacterium]|nr:cytochrome P450 [Acidimicrobiia bacterium]